MRRREVKSIPIKGDPAAVKTFDLIIDQGSIDLDSTERIQIKLWCSGRQGQVHGVTKQFLENLNRWLAKNSKKIDVIVEVMPSVR